MPRDRNRTSPFAFTGNKFEFRAVGSNQSISGPLLILNTIVAESLDYVATELEKATKGDEKKLPGAVQKLLQQIMKDHKAVIFNGDGYSEAWHQEAEKRGLPNLRNTVDAHSAVLSKESAALFETYGVLTKRELASRVDIYLERYCKDINTESLLALSIARKTILPTGYRYQHELARTAVAMKGAGKSPDTSSLDKVSALVASLEGAIEKLQHAVDHKAEGSILAHAKHYRDEVVPAMVEVRKYADALEGIVSDDLWPLPTYQEILFIK